MYLIVGLGNPGEKYANTRHNLGFMILDELARKMLPLAKTKWQFDKKFNSQFAIPALPAGRRNSQLILAKPQTFMNASGQAVSRISQYLKIPSSDIWVVHDDVDLPLGKMKIRLGGAAAGHHGVESIIQQLGTDQFVRFRLGIGHPSPKSVEKFVLEEFRPEEKPELKKLVTKAVKAIEIGLKDSLERAMNQFN